MCYRINETMWHKNTGGVTVDGIEIDVSAGGSWTGDIVVTPANASGEAS